MFADEHQQAEQAQADQRLVDLRRVHRIRPLGGPREAEVPHVVLPGRAPLRGQRAWIGADFLICPDNTIHQALPYIESQLPLRWLHIAEAVAAQAVGRRFRRLGLTGTRYLVESDVYPEKLKARGLEFVRPTPDEREEIHRIIMDELVYGIFKPEAVATFQRVIERMKDDGCDAVVLGCTEIPRLMNDENSPLPTLDSTRLLARSALRRAVQSRTVPA